MRPDDGPGLSCRGPGQQRRRPGAPCGAPGVAVSRTGPLKSCPRPCRWGSHGRLRLRIPALFLSTAARQREIGRRCALRHFRAPGAPGGARGPAPPRRPGPDRDLRGRRQPGAGLARLQRGRLQCLFPDPAVGAQPALLVRSPRRAGAGADGGGDRAHAFDPGARRPCRAGGGAVAAADADHGPGGHRRAAAAPAAACRAGLCGRPAAGGGQGPCACHGGAARSLQLRRGAAKGADGAAAGARGGARAGHRAGGGAAPRLGRDDGDPRGRCSGTWRASARWRRTCCSRSRRRTSRCSACCRGGSAGRRDSAFRDAGGGGWRRRGARRPGGAGAKRARARPAPAP